MPTKQTFTAGQVLTAQQLNDLQDYIGVVQVKSTAKTDTFSTSSTSYVDLTGLSVSITPTSASNKILVTFGLTASNETNFCYFQIVRDSTAIGVGAAAGNRTQATVGNAYTAASGTFAIVQSGTFLDSPATTSATTYKIQMLVAGGTGYVGRATSDTDVASRGRFVSTITVLEVTP